MLIRPGGLATILSISSRNVMSSTKLRLKEEWQVATADEKEIMIRKGPKSSKKI